LSKMLVLLLPNGLRECGIYIQWNFTQPQRRMRFCHSQVNGEHHLKQI
jgi:hypothetical protein